MNCALAAAAAAVPSPSCAPLSIVASTYCCRHAMRLIPVFSCLSCGIKTGSGGSFSATHNELIISGADTGNGVNLTAFPNQTGQHDDTFYELDNHRSDERGNPITDSLPSSGSKSHYHTCTGKTISSSSQHSSSMLIVLAW
eukprot:SAG22_NODE_1036_length_5904_cov_4.908355_4_plen_141_part_00